MAKKSIVEREKKRKLVFSKYNKLRLSLKSAVRKAESFEVKLHYQSLLQNLPRNSSVSRIVCIFINV